MPDQTTTADLGQVQADFAQVERRLVGEMDKTLLDTLFVPSNLTPKLSARIEKLNKRAKDANTPFYYTALARRPGLIWVESQPGVMTECVNIEIFRVSSVLPRKARFIARVSHLKDQPDGTKINEVSLAPDVAKVPGLFADIEPYCDHCKTRRKRIKTIMVGIGDTGAVVQLGAGCVGEYLGSGTTTYWASLVDIEASATKLIETTKLETRAQNLKYASYATPVVMALAVRNPSASQYTLSADVRQLVHKTDPTIEIQPPTEDELNQAKVIWHWLMLETQNSTVATSMSQARFSLSSPAISSSNFYFALIAVKAYNQHISRRNRMDQFSGSTHQGTVGEYLHISVKIRFMRSFNSDYGYGPRLTWLVSMHDEKNNLYSAYCSRKIEVEPGVLFKIKAKVKAHTAYEGLKETRLFWLKVLGVAESDQLALVSETSADNLPF